MDYMHILNSEAAQPNPSHHNGPAMELTSVERNWALRLREAVEQLDDLQNLTDMEYAQYAIITQGDIPKALTKLYGFQVFREEYGVDNSVEQAIEVLAEHFRQQPGYLLHLDVDPATNEPCVVMDNSAFYPSRTMQLARGRHHDFNWRVNLVRTYYEYYAATCSFSAIRQGIFLIIDCDGVGSENFNLEYATRFHMELWDQLALKFKHILCYNTTTVANVGWNLLRRLLDQNMKETLQLGCQLAEVEGAPTPERLSELYLQPSLEVAQHKCLTCIAKLVRTRNRNQALFRL